MKNRSDIIFIVLAMALMSLSPGRESAFGLHLQEDTLRVPELTFHYDTLTREDVQLFGKLPEVQKEVLLALNRLSENKIRSEKVLVVPDRWVEDRLAYSPFPDIGGVFLPLPKIIFVSLRLQAFAAYENGVLVRWGPVSTGKQATPTPPGLYFANWRSRLKRSTIDQDWLMPWYVNIENQQGIALHQYELPGYPASHGCVRLLQVDAVWFYHWAEGWVLDQKTGAILKNGTPVVIFGAYDFGSPGPWTSVVGNPDGSILYPDEWSELEDLMGSLQRRPEE